MRTLLGATRALAIASGMLFGLGMAVILGAAVAIAVLP